MDFSWFKWLTDNRNPYRRQGQRNHSLLVDILEDRVLLSSNPLLDAVYYPGTTSEVIQAFEDSFPMPAAPPANNSDPQPFQLGSRWSSTATNSGPLSQGQATTLTWSVVPDGTAISGDAGDPSNLITSFDAIYGSAATPLASKPWVLALGQIFTRWSQLTGLSYVYEANDDGVAINSQSGVIGVRGDIRVSGHKIDGDYNVLAYNWYPNSGDMVIDTADVCYKDTSNGSLFLRDVLAHEHGHGIGIGHVISNDASFLMEPYLNTSFDGPQLDDILGAQRMYGDVLEKNGGNETPAKATDLGSVNTGSTVSKGTLGSSTVVAATATDFLSIDDVSDTDYFKFTPASGTDVTITLSPQGTTYSQGPQGGSESPFNSKAVSDLALYLYDFDGTTLLGTANTQPAGSAEILPNIPITVGKTYYIRVNGVATNVQMYRIDVQMSAPGVVVTPSGGSTAVTEGGATDNYTVVLNTPPTDDVTISLAPDTQVQVSPTSLIFTTADWNILQTVTVTAVDDLLIEGTHTGKITHTAKSNDANYNNIAIVSLAATITDNDFPPGVIIVQSGGSTSVSEAGTTDTYTVVLNSVPTDNVIITLDPGTQLNVAPTSLIFSPTDWNVIQTVTVSAIDDSVSEGAHTGTISHTVASNDANYNNFTVASITASITDNDTAGVTVTQSGGSTAVTEGGATDTYTVVLTSQPTANVVITLNPGTQLTVAPTTLTFTAADWNTPQTVTVTAVNDNVAEGAHTGTISHTVASSDTKYNNYTIPNITANITDNDTAGVTVTQSGGSTAVTEGGATDTYTVVLTSQPTANVVITLNPGTQLTVAPTTLTFTTANWNMAQTVTVTAVNDNIAEGAHTGTISHTVASSDTKYNSYTIPNITVNITDNDTAGVTVTQSGGSTAVTEGGATDTYTVVLTSQPTANLVITLNPGTQLTVAPTTLTFTAANWNTAQMVTVTAVNDVIVEGTHAGTITHTAASSDTLYNNITIPGITATITDNDFPTGPAVLITQSGGSTSVAEGGATDSYTVVLNSAPTANVTITLNPGTQLTATPASLIFTPTNWNATQTVTVAAVDDSIAEGPHTGTTSHAVASSDNGYNGIATAAVTATITDNDTAGITVIQSGGSTDVSEAGITDTYTVVLTSQPTANVTIALNPGTQLTVTPTSLVFTPATWNTAQTVTVGAVDDIVVEGLHSGTITHTVTSSDGKYNNFTISDITATITDNDINTIPGVTIKQSGGTTDVIEGGATDSYTVVLDTLPTSNVTISLSGGSQLTLTPGLFVFTPANWDTPQTVTVAAIDDTVTQGLHTATITHSAGSLDPKYNKIIINTVTVNITDNDIPGVTIAPTGTSTQVTEGGANDTYTVVLKTRPTANVTVTLSPGSQLAVNPQTLIFTPVSWNSPRIITVSAVDDHIVEGPHAGTITHTAISADTFYNGIAIASLTVNIADNDVPGVAVIESGGATTVVEGQVADTYSVFLQSKPTVDVTINLTPGPQLVLDVSSLVFTPANWNVSQTVTVNALDDNAYTGLRTDTITQTISTTDAIYKSLTAASVTVNIIDDEGYLIQGTTGNDSIKITTSADLSQLIIQVNSSITIIPNAVQQLIIQSGNGDDNITLNNPVVPMSIDSGLGSDSLTINGQAGANNFTLGTISLTANGSILALRNLENLVVNGSDQNDSFNVQSNSAFPMKSVTFSGSLGDDRLLGPNQANTWKITGSNAGFLNSQIKFSAIENLTGGNARDSFVFSPGKPVTGQIDGGAGTDVLDYSQFYTPITVDLLNNISTGVGGGLQNVETFLGGKGLDTIIGPDLANVWNITDKNTGNVQGVSFQGFENLTGGSGNDTFTFAAGKSITGKLDGGQGTGDTLNLSAFATPISVNLQAKKATGISGTITNLEGITGPAALANTLIAASKTNTWTLTGSNAGNINDGTTTFTFAGMANLTGGAGSDSFSGTGTWTGKLDGGSGADYLAGSNTTHTWTITGQNAGTLDGRSFTGIENLTGGSGADTFVFKAGKSITGQIDGGSGTDVLDYSAFTTSVFVNLSTGKATGLAGLQNLENFLAGINTNNTLTAPNLDNAWALSASNQGQFTNTGGIYNFTSFANLTGGNQSDTFTLTANGAWTGYLQGGLGNDILAAYSGMTNTWTISTLNGHRFGSMESTQ